MPILSSVLGGLLGFGGSVAPAVINLIDKRNERAHIEKVKNIEIDAAKMGHEFTFKGIDTQAASAEATALLVHDSSLATDNKFIAAARAAVRPLITYLFFGLFLLVKLSALYVAFVVQNVALAPALIAIWDGDTAAIFAAVIGFWFGSRSIAKFGYDGLGSAPASPLSSTVLTTKK